MNAIRREAVRFSAVGILNTVAGIAVIFAGLSVLRLDYRVANTAGYLVVILAGFFLTKRWVFGSTGNGRSSVCMFIALL